MRLLNKIGLIGALGLSSIIGTPYANAKDSAGTEPKIVKEYQREIRVEIGDLLSDNPNNVEKVRTSFLKKLRDQKNLQDTMDVAYTQLKVLEDLAKTEKLPIANDYFKQQEASLVNIDSSAREVQLDELTPFRECETPVFNAYSQNLQLLRERELKKQGIETPAGYKLIPKGYFEQGTSDKEVKTIIGWLKENCPSFLQGPGFEFTDKCWLSERPYSNPVYLEDYFIMEKPVTNKEMKEFFDSDFAKKKGLKPFYVEDAKEYYKSLGLKKDDIEREFERSKKYMWNKEKQNYPEGQENYISLFNDLKIIEEYAEWKGARLSTEEEFEKANRGSDNRIYPWGYRFKPYHTKVRKLDVGAIVSIQDTDLSKDTDYISPFGVKFGGLFGCLTTENNKDNSSDVNKYKIVLKGYKGRDYAGYSGYEGLRQRISSRYYANDLGHNTNVRGYTITLVKDIPKKETSKPGQENNK